PLAPPSGASFLAGHGPILLRRRRLRALRPRGVGHRRRGRREGTFFTCADLRLRSDAQRPSPDRAMGRDRVESRRLLPRRGSPTASRGAPKVDLDERDRGIGASRTMAAFDHATRRSESAGYAVRFAAGGASPRAGARTGRAIGILYVGGYGRSGSTLLERLLGASDRIAALGEIAYLSDDVEAEAHWSTAVEHELWKGL